jgi:hypothetical protein
MSPSLIRLTPYAAELIRLMRNHCIGGNANRSAWQSEGVSHGQPISDG